jgi:tetratricopeptide (TPR) repeat protein
MNRILSVAVAFAVAAASGGAVAFADYKQAVMYYNQGRYDRAIQELKPDLDKNPDWEFGHRLAGLSYLNLKNNALAVASLTRAVQLKSTAFSTYVGLAQAYFNMQRYENSLQVLEQAEPMTVKQNERERYKVHHLRGSAHYQLERFQQAADELTAAIRISSADWTDFSQLGIAYFKLNRHDDAIQALLKALALRPGHTISAEFLAKSYFRKGIGALTAKQYGEAVDHLRKARDYNPRDGFIYYNMAEAYLFQKNYSEAEKALNEALALLPRSAEVYQRLGLVYEKQKKWDLSLNAYGKAQELAPSPGLKEALDRVAELKKR